MEISESIKFTEKAAEELINLLNTSSYNKIAVLVDENTKAHCYPLLERYLPQHTLVEINSGESHKTLETCTYIWQELTSAAFDRKSLFINLGGGVIGDMGGFCASTYKRGIDFINIPTTLLSQVDASVGGKLGIDFNGYKNHIGLFKEPIAVIIDQTFLKTLPANELRSGFAEVIKHHLIADKSGWDKLQTLRFPDIAWNECVKHSVKIKSDVVENDPLESGMRKILNFGHTIGHAIESYLLNNNRAILHGEAIAAGMICESFISLKRGYINEEELKQIEKYVLNIFDKLNILETDLEGINQYLIQDKKNRENKVLASLLQKVGEANWDISISNTEATEAIIYYNNL
ncbi:3-dehydroquinate synthase [Fulvivirga maritima]|uniref:3-dehydroquinate synthase n=1 Tax=Fulvivirga maritima TaxID=2904247 RepID=UPI001F2F9F3E|nr:3-dehydroquinate synthase [Fulvivirga maritima]UII29250.1 3-dehydroquinate synthase [Fulvivirga maritima]